MNVLIIFDHPRRDSFCGAVLNSLVDGLAAAGHRAQVADLRAEGFDPRLPREDEPDWSDPKKVYSDVVLAEQARISQSDALAFVFPSGGGRFPRPPKAGSIASGATVGRMATTSLPSARHCCSAPRGRALHTMPGAATTKPCASSS